MPVIDYVCTSCSNVDSTFVPASQCGSEHPESESSACTKCNGVSERNYSGGSPSTGFLVPPVVHYNPVTGQYSIPGHRDDPVDRGYQKVEIRDMRAYSKLTKSVNQYEREKAQFLQAHERAYFDQVLKEHRTERKQQVEKAVAQGGYWKEWIDGEGRKRREWLPVTGRAMKFLEASVRYADRSIAARRQRVQSGEANFHSRMLEMDGSERSIVDGKVKKSEVLKSTRGRR